MDQQMGAGVSRAASACNRSVCMSSSNGIRNLPCLVAGELPHRQLPTRLIFKMDMRKGLIVFVTDDETCRQFFNRPRQRELAVQSDTHSSTHFVITVTISGLLPLM